MPPGRVSQIDWTTKPRTTPVAFIYQEENHPPSYQVRHAGEGGGSECCTSNWGQIVGVIKAYRARIVFLDDTDLDAMELGPEDRKKCRPFTPKEQLDAFFDTFDEIAS